MQKKDIISTLLKKVAEKGVGSDETINLFWKKQLVEFSACLKEASSPPELEDILNALGYNEDHLPEGVTSNRLFPRTEKLIRFVQGPLLEQQKSFHASLPGKSDTEHLCSLFFLKRKGKLDEYLNFVDSLGFVSSMPLIRYWWYYKKLR